MKLGGISDFDRLIRLLNFVQHSPGGLFSLFEFKVVYVVSHSWYGDYGQIITPVCSLLNVPHSFRNGKRRPLADFIGNNNT